MAATAEITLKPWLYTIARNRCLSLLRARREQTAELEEIPTDGLHEQVERRADLRELLGDLRELPEEQREALLLAEAADLSHAEVADVLGCEVGRVKALVFRARSGLIERREARETPCADIREQLANLRGGSLRRSELRHHLRHCAGCSEYREQVRRQRQMLAVALPVMPSMGLKSSVLSAAGIGGGAAGGGAAAAAGGGAVGAAAAGGGGMAFGGALGSATVAKVALVAALAGGGAVASERVIERANGPAEPATATPVSGHGSGEGKSGTGDNNASARGEQMRTERSHGLRGIERSSARANGHAKAGTRRMGVKENARGNGGRKLGRLDRLSKQKPAEPRGRGQTKAPERGNTKAPVEQQAPTAKPAPQPRVERVKPAPPVSKPVAPEAAAEPLPAPKATPPGQLKLPK